MRGDEELGVEQVHETAEDPARHHHRDAGSHFVVEDLTNGGRDLTWRRVGFPIPQTVRYRIHLGVDGEAVSGERIGMEEHGKVVSVAGGDDFTDELRGRHGQLAGAAGSK